MPSIHEEHKKGRIYLARSSIVLSIEVVLFLILISRLFYLQVVKYNTFKSLSEDNRIKTTVIPPLRGNFHDRNNIQLTDNISSYRVILYNQNKKESQKSVKDLSKLLKLNKKEEQKIFTKLKKNEHSVVISLIDNLSWEDLIKVEANTYRLNGISIEEYYMRKYLRPESMVHVIGYIAQPTEDEASKDGVSSELYLHPDYRIGKGGLEKTLDSKIIGKSGYKRIEVNAFGVPIRDIETKESKPGENIKLTVDADVQKYATEKLEGKRGSVVLLDVNTGEILAMISSPSFDPNDFVYGISYDKWSELIDGPTKPLMNKAVDALYSPGSTFKLIVALAGLENGWDANTKNNCTGKVWQNSRWFHCWKKSGHGNINLEEAIMESCNIYFSKLGLYTGIDNISNIAEKFGLGQKFDIDINMKEGIVPSRKWKKEKLSDVWVKGDTVNTAIGQGFTLVSPIQLAVMVSRIANGGYPIEPFLIYDSPKRKSNKELFKKDPIVSEKNIEVIKKSMYRVVNDKQGTSYWNRIINLEYAMSGKTGTTQVISRAKKEELEKENEELEERFRNHALFIGFAPYDKPKYGIAVVIEHGGGGYAAVPIARDILFYIQRKNDAINSNL